MVPDLAKQTRQLLLKAPLWQTDCSNRYRLNICSPSTLVNQHTGKATYCPSVLEKKDWTQFRCVRLQEVQEAELQLLDIK